VVNVVELWSFVRLNVVVIPVRGMGQGSGIYFCGGLPVAMSKEQTTATAKYRDLSTAAAKCAAFGRDDVFIEWWKRAGNSYG
jgi:hypothetical protein